MTEEGRWRSRRLGRGRALLSGAHAAFEDSMSAPDAESAERLARDSLRLVSSAFNWLEDTELEDSVHEEIHMMGRSVRERFPDGCILAWTGAQYEHRCPVALSHKRFGFSPGMVVGKRVCSICGEDASECEHLRDRDYSVVGGPGPSGRCPVCLQDSCDHSPSETYTVTPASIITEIIRVDHIAIVSRPVQPDARLSAVPIDQASIVEALPPEFNYGLDTVYCSQCLGQCHGFDRMPGDPRLIEETGDEQG